MTKHEGSTYPEQRLRDEAVVHEHAHRTRKELVLARVLDPALDERRRRLPRHAHVLQRRREPEHRDRHLVCDPVARQRHLALHAICKRERALVEHRALRQLEACVVGRLALGDVLEILLDSPRDRCFPTSGRGRGPRKSSLAHHGRRGWCRGCWWSGRTEQG